MPEYEQRMRLQNESLLRTDDPIRDAVSQGWSVYRQYDWDLLGPLFKQKPQIFLEPMLVSVRNAYRVLTDEDLPVPLRAVELLLKLYNNDVTFRDPFRPIRRELRTAFNPSQLDYEFEFISPTSSRQVTAMTRVMNNIGRAMVLRLMEMLGPPELIYQNIEDEDLVLDSSLFRGLDELSQHIFVSAVLVWGEDLLVRLTPSVDGAYSLAGSMSLKMWARFLDINVPTEVYLAMEDVVKSSPDDTYCIEDFSTDEQDFARRILEEVPQRNHITALCHGLPGTGKTTFVNAFARQHLLPKGYAVFVMNARSFERFVPPSYINRICIIINEVDNLVPRRELDMSSGRPEQMLMLLDGTISTNSSSKRSLVVLMTCNDTSRIDPAMFRQGRIRFCHHFTEVFDSSTEMSGFDLNEGWADAPIPFPRVRSVT